MPERSPAPGSSTPAGVTRLLNHMTRGEEVSEEGLPLRVYDELRALAAHHMGGERVGHTLQATALVSEAYLRLVGDPHLGWDSRRHFYSAAAEAMRRILIEHARRRGRRKRGGDWRRISLDAADLAAAEDSAGILALDEALRRLEEVDERAAAVVRMRFFAGLGVEETALALDLSRRTVLREWAYARAWLAKVLHELDEP